MSSDPVQSLLLRLGKAFVDPTRCRVLLCLLDGAHYPTDLADHLGLSKASVSNHLSCLRGCGLVVGTAEGRRVRYELADPKLLHAMRDLVDLAGEITLAECHADVRVA